MEVDAESGFGADAGVDADVLNAVVLDSACGIGGQRAVVGGAQSDKNMEHATELCQR
ncbi:hypothetical protein E0500_014795 [Streptomyces sp. KM273126]|uniref:hypothetical protein n=1 Tax=Streptomyces sp. KM273126 TaxID=2545247 RepID=UPI00140489D7|nr:hypothetical protein [Streptomyces sp. KM273126]MBA2808630.1 hypothetical protein [Streptomyces sp. KM273126]